MIVFISNFLNHHQVNICNELAKKDEFYFIASIPVAQEQLRLGYSDMNNEYDFVVRMYESEEKKAEAQKLIDDADIVIAGSCAFPFEMLVPRLEADKLTFWFSERLFKISNLELFYPPKLKRVLSQCTKYRKNKNFFLLCAGGYVADDYKKYNAFKGKCFNWGYFPKSFVKTENELFENKDKEKIRLLWAGRYLKLKHPEYAIIAAELLKKHNVEFVLEMIGSGVLYDKISDLIKEKKLNEYVVQKGALPYQNVREYMNQADIFLFTSDRKEGWGAVLNESMNSACVVIANEKIGSAKSIIVHGVNGLIYKGRKQFERQLLDLVENKNKIKTIGKNGYNTIVDLWSAEIAADRFYNVATSIINGCNLQSYESGPMMMFE